MTDSSFRFGRRKYTDRSPASHAVLASRPPEVRLAMMGPMTRSQIGWRAVPRLVRMPMSNSPPPPLTGAARLIAGSTPTLSIEMIPPSELPH